MEKLVALDHHHHQEQLQQHQKQQALKCPRCDSLNTKFCYYNNYSLSQPRHFCKGCKRYWTRGGTLRNVPVGGGCRKNKRVKIQPITTTATTITATAIDTTSSLLVDRNPNPNLDRNPNTNPNPLFYGFLSQNPSEYRRVDARVFNASDSLVSGYDFSQPYINDTGLGFSNLDPGVANHSQNPSLFLSCHPSSVFVGSTYSSTSAPTMAAILASGLEQQRFMAWNNSEQIEVTGSSDPASLLWNTTVGGSGGGGGWFDPTSNIGSSVPSLI